MRSQQGYCLMPAPCILYHMPLSLAEASGYISIRRPVQKEMDCPGSYDRNWNDERTLAKTACSSSAYVTWGACCTIETRLLP
jgi:hypothetical protein